MPQQHRDIVVIGGSAGSLEAIRDVLSVLGPDFGAAVFVVIHSGSASPGFLADILSSSTCLPVGYAVDHTAIELGRVYVAPVGHHLLVKTGELRVIIGPKENGFRPAIDPLFRTAAQTYPGRVIGVIMSGMQDDGAHGLLHIKHGGGLAIVQCPAEAIEPGMPTAAIAAVQVDHVLPIAEIGKMLNSLVGEGDAQDNFEPVEAADVAEGLISALRLPVGKQPTSPYICPDCGGPLWRIEAGKLLRFRCHNGHGFTLESLQIEQNAVLEQSLWSVIRLLEEQADLQRGMADRSLPDLRPRFLDKAKERARLADLVRSLVTARISIDESPLDWTFVEKEYSSEQQDKAM
jgi:two-component system, chemotaxis family, protein-glutamate methylesterase/glutaminase